LKYSYLTILLFFSFSTLCQEFGLQSIETIIDEYQSAPKEDVSFDELHQSILASDHQNISKAQFLYITDSMYYRHDEFEKLGEFLNTFEMNSISPDTSLYVEILRVKANELKRIEDFDVAITYFEKAKEFSKAISTVPEEFARLLYEYQFIYSTTDPSKMFEILQEAETAVLKIKPKNILLERKILSEILKYYNQLGYYEEAEQYLDRIWKPYLISGKYDFPDLETEGDYLYEHMFFYRISGEMEKAKVIFQKTIQFEKANKNNLSFPFISIAGTYTHYGDLLVGIDPKSAIQPYELALSTNPDTNSSYYLQYLFNLCKAYLYSDYYLKADDLADKILDIAIPSKDFRLSFFYALKANIALKLDDSETVISFYNKMINTVHQGEDTISLLYKSIFKFQPNSMVFETFMLETMAKRVKENTTDQKVFNQLIFGLAYASLLQLENSLNEQKPNTFLVGIFHSICTLLFEANRQDNALELPLNHMINVSENLNAAYLWKQFQEKQLQVDFIDEEILEEEQLIRKEILELKKALSEQENENSDEDLFELELALAEIEKAKQLQYPNYDKFTTYEFDIYTYQQSICDECIEYKFERVGEELFVYIITKDSLRYRKVDDYKSVEKTVETYYQWLSTPNSSIDSIHFHSSKLYRKLFVDDISSFKKVRIIPDEILCFLPFETLRNDDYLLKTYYISYSNSLMLSNKSYTQNKVNCVGLYQPSYDENPELENLSGARKEIDAIFNNVSGDKILDKEASKINFVQLSKNYDILHLALHSDLREDDPELSVLHFSTDELYLYELYGLKLNAKLAVLSACNTAIGREKTGDGLVSMNRAFTYSGVPSVVSSLWKTPDIATSSIMSDFYHNLKEGKSKEVSLQEAKLNYASNNEYSKLSHPYFWAGFVIYGNVDSLEFESNSNVYYYLIAPFMVLFVFYYFKKGKFNS